MIGDERGSIRDLKVHAAFQCDSPAAVDVYFAHALDYAPADEVGSRNSKISSITAAILLAAVVSHRSPFSAVAGRGSPITPLAAMSRVSHAKFAAPFS